MSDKTDKQDAESEEQDAPGPRAGERLAEARREKQITIVEIAKELHLDEPKVRALERNDFDTLGAPVFAKGHLRKYAMLVDIDPDDVLTEYYEMNRSGPAPLVISPRAKPRTELTPGPWIAVFIVAVFIAFAPLEDPRIAVAVVVENGSSGSRVAAPNARAIMDTYLGYDDDAI